MSAGGEESFPPVTPMKREKHKNRDKRREKGRNTNGTNVLMRNFLFRTLNRLWVSFMSDSFIHCWVFNGQLEGSVKSITVTIVLERKLKSQH